MAVIIIQRAVNLDAALYTEPLHGTLYGGEQDSHEFIISATREGAAHAFDGTTTARFIRADGETLMLSGMVAGGKCIVELPQACYAVPGRFTLTIFNTTDAGAKGAVYSCTGNVAQTTTGEELDPGSAVPDIDDIQAEYQRMQAATDAATAAAAAGNGALRALGPYNAFDALAALPKTNATFTDGVAFTWDAEGNCHVSGTATSARVNNLWSNTSAFPLGIEPGKSYSVTCTATGTFASNNPWFWIQWYIDGAWTAAIYSSINGTSTISVPANAVGARIRFGVSAGMALDVVLTPQWLCGTPHQKMLDGSNLLASYTPAGNTFSLWDDMPNACYWSGLPSYFTSSIDDASIVFDENTTYQIIKLLTRVYICAPNVKQFYVGQRANSGVQYWYDLSNLAPETFIPRSVLAAGDLDAVRTPGYYVLQSNTVYTHAPFEARHPGVLIVFPVTANSIGQIAISNTGGMFWRMSLLGTFPEHWSAASVTYNNTYLSEHYENSYSITCTPNITTDTNNYIAGPGDETDMAGAIQTMLRQTGVCHLGPGRFIISTGIEVPDYGALIGSGPTTVLILSDGVTTGYAVKLNSYACVKDIRLAKKNSATYAPSADVGSCHGILFEATGDASTGATYEQVSIIDNCWIHGFNGGAITCSNTGIAPYHNLLVSNCHIWQCDAGLYIPYRSEFHRFANVSVTRCYYGCVDNGGNNNFTNCNFSADTVGLLIDNSTGQSPNNSHGTFSGCTFNHSGGNTGTAIRLLGLTAGEVFTGAQIFYGAIDIQNSVGVRFVGANIGRQVPISVTGSTVVTFADSTMYSLAENPYTGSGNTAVKFTDCYIRDGSAYNPVS